MSIFDLSWTYGASNAIAQKEQEKYGLHFTLTLTYVKLGGGQGGQIPLETGVWV